MYELCYLRLTNEAIAFDKFEIPFYYTEPDQRMKLINLVARQLYAAGLVKLWLWMISPIDFVLSATWKMAAE